MRYALCIIPFLLLGCDLASPQSRYTGTSSQILNLGDDIAEKTAAKTATVDAKMKTVQDNITGLLSGKIDEVGKLLDINNKLENKMYASVNTELSNVMKAVTDINLKIESKVDIRADLKALSDNVLKVQASIEGMGQAGIGNSMSKVLETMQQELKAGRDVFNTSFPKEAVDIMVAQMKYDFENNKIESKYQYLGLIAILVVLKLILLYSYKNARQREDNTLKLLMKALGELDPGKASTITENMK